MAEPIEPQQGSPTERATVVVSRVFDAPPENVLDAWLDPQTVGKWLFATPTGQSVRVEIDARVSGKFVIAERRNGEDFEHIGEYLEIDRPRRLAFTFGVPKFSSESTTVTLDIVPHGTGSKLTLTHQGVLPEYRDRTQTGWTTMLAGLANTMAVSAQHEA